MRRVELVDTVSDTTRCYARTLVEAFPVSEGYTQAIFGPEEHRPRGPRPPPMLLAIALFWAAVYYLLRNL